MNPREAPGEDPAVQVLSELPSYEPWEPVARSVQEGLEVLGEYLVQDAFLWHAASARL